MYSTDQLADATDKELIEAFQVLKEQRKEAEFGRGWTRIKLQIDVIEEEMINRGIHKWLK